MTEKRSSEEALAAKGREFEVRKCVEQQCCRADSSLVCRRLQDMVVVLRASVL